MMRRTSLGLLAATLATSAGVLFAAPASAAGTTLYAEPGGQLNACTSQDPCNIDAAFAKAATGDTISLAGGSYTDVGGVPFASEIALAATGVTVVDTTSKLPVVQSNANAAIFITANSTITGLTLIYTGPKVGLDIDKGGFANKVTITDSTAGTACVNDGTLVNSVCVNTGGGTAVGYAGFTNTVGPVIRGVTAVSPKSGGVGIKYAGGAGGDASVTVTDTIARGAALDVEAATSDINGATTITLDHSDFVTAVAQGNPGTASIVTGVGNISASPKFVNAAAGNYREAAGSPTIDKGAKAWAAEFDVVGLSRKIGNGPDIGAYEHTIAPKISTPKVTRATKSAKAKLTVNPEGLTGTVRFKASVVKPPKGFTGKKTLTSKPAKLAAVVKGTSVTISLKGLVAKTKYTVVVIAKNSAGSTTSKPIKITTK